MISRSHYLILHYINIVCLTIFVTLLSGECVWLHMKLIKEMQDFCKELFPVVDYCFSTVPTYPSGQIGYTVCSLNPVI